MIWNRPSQTNMWVVYSGIVQNVTYEKGQKSFAVEINARKKYVMGDVTFNAASAHGTILISFLLKLCLVWDVRSKF